MFRDFETSENASYHQPPRESDISLCICSFVLQNVNNMMSAIYQYNYQYLDVVSSSSDLFGCNLRRGLSDCQLKLSSGIQWFCLQCSTVMSDGHKKKIKKKSKPKMETVLSAWDLYLKMKLNFGIMPSSFFGKCLSSVLFRIRHSILL